MSGNNLELKKKIELRNKFALKIKLKVDRLNKYITSLLKVDKKLFMNQTGGTFAGTLHKALSLANSVSAINVDQEKESIIQNIATSTNDLSESLRQLETVIDSGKDKLNEISDKFVVSLENQKKYAELIEELKKLKTPDLSQYRKKIDELKGEFIVDEEGAKKIEGEIKEAIDNTRQIPNSLTDRLTPIIHPSKK